MSMKPVLSACLFILVGLAPQAHPASGAPADAAADRHPGFSVDPAWPRQLPHGYVLGQIGGLTTDGDGNIWVLSRPRALVTVLNDPPDAASGVAAPAVIQLSPDGRFLRGWGGPFAARPGDAAYDWPVQEHGIAVDSRGNVWICGNGRDAAKGLDDDQCLKFTADGKFLLQIGSSGRSMGSLDTVNLNHPSQPVYWPGTNELFVSDGYVNRRIIVFDADTGVFKRMWGAYGEKPDDNAPRTRSYNPPPRQFNLVHGLVIAADGTLYVADRNNNRVQAFTLDGRFLKENFVAPQTPQTGLGTVFSLALSSDPAQRFLYVAEGHNQKVRVLDRQSLKEIPGSAFGHVGPYPGQFAGLHVIAADGKGNLYTGDGRDGRVQKFRFKALLR